MEKAQVFTLLKKDRVAIQAGWTKQDYLAGVGYDVSNRVRLSAGAAIDKDEGLKDVEPYVGVSYTVKF